MHAPWSHHLKINCCCPLNQTKTNTRSVWRGFYRYYRVTFLCSGFCAVQLHDDKVQLQNSGKFPSTIAPLHWVGSWIFDCSWAHERHKRSTMSKLILFHLTVWIPDCIFTSLSLWNHSKNSTFIQSSWITHLLWTIFSLASGQTMGQRSPLTVCSPFCSDWIYAQLLIQWTMPSCWNLWWQE